MSLDRRSFLARFAGIASALAGTRLLPAVPEAPKGLLPAGQPMGDFLTVRKPFTTLQGGGLGTGHRFPPTYDVTIGGEPVVLGTRETFHIHLPDGIRVSGWSA